MDYQAIVVGGGHAGLEAALALARLGNRTLLVTQNPDAIGRMSCNPAIGGLSKGNLVRELDALGGEMGRLIDLSMIQYRVLNRSRGPAVRAPRAQADKALYSALARKAAESCPGLSIRMDSVVDLILDAAGGAIEGVVTERGARIGAKALVLATGTFLEGRIFIGDWSASSGRMGEPAALGLGPALARLGLPVGRLKTGTPARVKAGSVDLESLELQTGEEPRAFSFYGPPVDRPGVPCRIAWTTDETHAIIRAGIGRSPLFSGKIVGQGPRYCPSIEDKVMRFPDRERHQVFVEPEGLGTDELYLNGLSTSLPEDLQEAFIRSIPGFSRAEIVRPGYAVEYDYVDPLSLDAALRCKRIKGLFRAGQINGTSGYEEAAAQGVLAGINAALFLRGEEPLVLPRSLAYLGVMADDLSTMGVREPYRMFTSRAEYRLSLRHDSADERLSPIAIRLGLLGSREADAFARKRGACAALRDFLLVRRLGRGDLEGLSEAESAVLSSHVGESLATILGDPRVAESGRVEALIGLEEAFFAMPTPWMEAELIRARYAGYLEKEARLVARFEKGEGLRIPAGFDYTAVNGLSTEAKEKLSAARPLSVGQASRVGGVRQADAALLLAWLSR